MELMNLSELAKAADRHKTTLKRYHERGEIPTDPLLGGVDPEDGRIYGQAALDFVGTLRKNKPRQPREVEPEPEPSETDEAMELVEARALDVAKAAARNHMRIELEQAVMAKDFKLQAALHRRIADMLDEHDPDKEDDEPPAA